MIMAILHNLAKLEFEKNIYLFTRQKEMLHQVVRSLNTYSSGNWAGLNLGAGTQSNSPIYVTKTKFV